MAEAIHWNTCDHDWLKRIAIRPDCTAWVSAHGKKFQAQVCAAGDQVFCEDFDTIDKAAEAAERAMTVIPREEMR